MGSIYRTILKRRTIRKFKPRRIPYSILKKLANAGHLAPSAANLQPLEYFVVDKTKQLETVFPHLRWANYIAPYGTPPLDNRPVAYIAILVNKKREIADYSAYDVGLATENIILAAWEQGIGICIIKAMDKEKLEVIFSLPKYLRLDSILALGYRAENPKTEPLKKSVKYWKDSRGRLHVPKRALSDVLHHNRINFSGLKPGVCSKLILSGQAPSIPFRVRFGGRERIK